MCAIINNCIDTVLVVLLTQTINTLAGDRYYYHGRDCLNHNFQEERPNWRIARRSAGFNSDDCIPPKTTTTTSKPPFGFFINFGGNDWLQTTTTNRPQISDEDSYEENSKPDSIVHDDRRPCGQNHDHYHHYHHHHPTPLPSTTSFPPFFGGFRFGAPPQNPFVPSNDNNNNNNNFFNNINNNNNNNNNNPQLRGGLIFGAPPQLDNPLIPKSTDKEEPTTTAKFWCTKYQSECKTKEEPRTELRARIIGGNPASPRDHKHMVMVGYGSAEDKHWLCGGSLISPKFVLSAAHCTRASKWGKARWARVGDLDLSTRTDDESPQERMIVKRYNHPEYKEPAVYNDIAIYKLDNDVTITDWVSPICLQTTTEVAVSQVVVTGWGRTAFVQETSPVLMEVEISLYNDSECIQLLNNTAGNRLPKGIDTRMMLCAGVNEGGKDACSGDSGGPLISETANCAKIQVGITSIGRECGLPNSPGIYTRISYYIPWIVSIVWPT